jgi:hypothetical protein
MANDAASHAVTSLLSHSEIAFQICSSRPEDYMDGFRCRKKAAPEGAAFRISIFPD